MKRRAHTRRLTTAFDKPPFTNNSVWVRRCVLLGFRVLSAAKSPFKGGQGSKWASSADSGEAAGELPLDDIILNVQLD